MSEPASNRLHTKSGSALTLSLVLLITASVSIGIVLGNANSYGRMAKRSLNMDQAKYLADAGINAAIADLNKDLDGDGRPDGDEANTISKTASRAYFANESTFGSADWGFTTRCETNDIGTGDGTSLRITSTGHYNGITQHIEAVANLQHGTSTAHYMMSLAMYAGNSSGSNYTLQVGGQGNEVDFVHGNVYSGGNIDVSDGGLLRHPEVINEETFDGIYDPETETWTEAFAPTIFTNPLNRTEFDTYAARMASYSRQLYNNRQFDEGEAFIDSIGNGEYDEGETFTDVNDNGQYDRGDSFYDNNFNGVFDEGVDDLVDLGNGKWDVGEEWTDGPQKKRKNGRYDPAGGFWQWQKRKKAWVWRTSFKTNGKVVSCAKWPAEAFEDVGDGIYDPAEPYIDQNGVYDIGEEYFDDRNNEYDFGTQAFGTISGMPAPAAGQLAATGNNAELTPPDLQRMHYHKPRSGTQPDGAYDRWGHHIKVSADDYEEDVPIITDPDRPEHIFTRNLRVSSYNGQYTSSHKGITVRSRGYAIVHDKYGNRIDDYFLEDPTDESYTTFDKANSIDGTTYTAPAYIDVKPEANDKVYYVDGNLYLHASPTFALRFKNPGTRITIVAKGNITIADEFYYNADYPEGLERSDVDSTIVENPKDALCLIALKNPNCDNSGNIYIGDPAHGTGGSIHALLYAENNFIDNNLDTANQPFISIFGTMAAGNHIALNRDSNSGTRTRLDITADGRINKGSVSIPGLPYPSEGEMTIKVASHWVMEYGSWNSWSSIDHRKGEDK